MIKTFLPFLFLVISIASFSQKATTLEQQNLQIDTNWKEAMTNIHKLKTGTLLVALDFKAKKVAYYNKYNNTKAANKLETQQLEINRNIIHSIDSLYTFSKVLYFNVDDLRKVKEKKLKEITFYNSLGEKDASMKLSTDFFLVGSFSTVSENYEEEATYAAKNSVNAFVLLDENLKQLKRPFPYYSTYHPNYFVSKRYLKPTRRLQENLELFEKGGEVKYNKREKRRAEKRARLAKKNQAKNQ
ncbi:MAG TPA: hypothetical protein EYG86_02940 [Crocinitomicaceae bacterium]|nr:hypothetical protein [Crocinitomicaceae bacterium]